MAVYNTPMNTVTIVCFEIKKKMFEKASCFLAKFILKFAYFIYPIPYEPCCGKLDFVACKQQRRRSACASTQQLALESIIAKPATCKNENENIIPSSDMRVRIQTTPTGPGGGGGGGGGGCFSREVRTSFSS